MGLDMYLNRRIFLWSDERKNLKITGLRREIRTDKVSYIIVEHAPSVVSGNVHVDSDYEENAQPA